MKRRTVKFVLLAVLLVLFTYSIFWYFTKDPYSFSGDEFAYSKYRGSADYETELRESNVTYNVYNISFMSRDFLNYKTKIYGLLFLPKGKQNVPGVVLLPGGGVKKESEAKVAKVIANEGYAVLTIDQRGIGQTGGIYLNFEDDYKVFAEGKKPIQHLSVYDALKSFDVLRKIEGVDKNNIVMAGESMGGRYAIIAGAIDDGIKGVLVISSAGFHYKGNNEYSNYLLSVDPDHYAKGISPRAFIMLHGTNDTTVPIESAKVTFELANEPKKFYTAEGCGHGYCGKMRDDLVGGLREMFGK